jgi:hypothetical protein
MQRGIVVEAAIVVVSCVCDLDKVIVVVREVA